MRQEHGEMGENVNMDIKIQLPKDENTNKRYVTLFRGGSFRDYFSRNEFSHHENCLVSKYLNSILTFTFYYDVMRVDHYFYNL